MDGHEKVSDFFLGLVGVAAIGLLISVMLFGVLSFSGTSEVAYIDVSPPPVNQDRN